MVMRNIFFDTDSSTLKPESIVELNRLVISLTFNKSLLIEIGGHTDNQRIDTPIINCYQRRGQKPLLII